MNEFKVYIAWDENPEDFHITYSQQLFQNSRLATIDECKNHAGDFDGFIEATNDGRVVILKEGKFNVVWETTNNPLFPEYYLYFVNGEGKHLIY